MARRRALRSHALLDGGARRILYPTAALSLTMRIIIGIPRGKFVVTNSSETQPFGQLNLGAVSRVPESPQFVPDRVDRELVDVVDVDRTPIALREFGPSSR